MGDRCPERLQLWAGMEGAARVCPRCRLLAGPLLLSLLACSSCAKAAACPSALRNISVAIAKPDCQQKGLHRTPEGRGTCWFDVVHRSAPVGAGCSVQHRAVWAGPAIAFWTGMCPGACAPALLHRCECW